MATLDRIRLLHGPDVPWHLPTLEGWRAAGEAEWGVNVTLTHCLDEAELLTALASAPGAGTGVILAPGSLASSPAIQRRAAELAGPALVWLELEAVAAPPPDLLVAAGVRTVRGRGVDGRRWALRTLLEQAAWPATTVAYGEGRDQVADLRLPAGDGPHPVVVLIHGGAWRVAWERDLMDALGVDLARRGYASWNVEYRRVGEGGGWPTTFEDMAAALDQLAALDARLDLARVVLVGHSAGGHLALWAAARDRLATEAPGGDPRVAPALVVSLAGLPDLVDSARLGVYDRATDGLMGGLPAELPERYAAASPHLLLPLATPQLLVHGTADLLDNVDMNRRYFAQARAAGDPVELLELKGADHFDVIEPRSVAWAAIAAELELRVPVAPSGRRAVA